MGENSPTSQQWRLQYRQFHWDWKRFDLFPSDEDRDVGLGAVGLVSVLRHIYAVKSLFRLFGFDIAKLIRNNEQSMRTQRLKVAGRSNYRREHRIRRKVKTSQNRHYIRWSGNGDGDDDDDGGGVAGDGSVCGVKTNEEKSEKSEEKFSEQFSQSLWRKVDKFSYAKNEIN